MKTMSILFVAIAFLVFIPFSTYAFVDFSLYGGYSLGGEMEMGDLKNNVQSGTIGKSTADLEGWEYGFLAHINTGIPMLFTAGIGGFFQVSPLKYEYKYEQTKKEFDATKSTFGIDGYAQLDLPLLPVYPYLRGGIAIKDETKIDTIDPLPAVFGTQGSIKEQITQKYFRSYYYGLGLSYPLFDFVVMDIQLFAEYLFNTSKQEDDVVIKGHSIHGGVKFAL